MINSLAIQNFQSHKKTNLEFDNGINIIIGQSDSGKSAILRALNWVINNKPSGETFRSNWGGDTGVNLELDNDKRIVRAKTKVGNVYTFFNDSKDSGGDFKSFGQDVPEEIKELLNFSPLNMANQFESPFLLSMSGGEVARYLNKIVHLDVIDKSLSNIGRLLVKERADLKYKEEDFREAELKLLEFRWLDKAEGELVALEGFQGKLKDQKDTNRKLELLIEKIEGYGKDLEQLPDMSKYSLQVEKLEYKLNELERRKAKGRGLNACIENILVKEGEIRTIEKNLGSWESQFEAMMPEQCPLCGRGD